MIERRRLGFQGAARESSGKAGSLMRLAAAADLDDCLSGLAGNAKERETKKKKRKRGEETLSRAKTARQVGSSLFTLTACRRALTLRGGNNAFPLSGCQVDG